MTPRPWTDREDAEIRRAAAESRRDGYRWVDRPDGSLGPRRRLAEVAERIGRSYAAVRKRASRLGVASNGRPTR